MRLGSAPSQNVNLALATDAEWTMVTSVDCTPEFGCARGAFNAAQSTTEDIDSGNRVTTGNIGVDYFFSG